MKAQKKKIVYRAYKFWGKLATDLNFISYVRSKSMERIDYDPVQKMLIIHKDTPMYLTAGNWLIENDLRNGTCEFWVVETSIFSKTYKKVGENLYQKKPVKIDAYEFRFLNPDTVKEAYSFMKIRPSADMIQQALRDGFVWIQTLEGPERLKPGSVLVKGVNGEHYQMPSQTFYSLYDVISK